ncbi:hypothetical protein RFI_36512, partial [Reticulomyxa filosa]
MNEDEKEDVNESFQLWSQHRLKEKKDEEKTTIITINGKKEKITMNEWTLLELHCQIYSKLDSKYFEQMKQSNMIMEIVNDYGTIIQTDQDLFQNNCYQVIWKSSQQQQQIQFIKTIKKALVIMIGISKYIDN